MHLVLIWKEWGGGKAAGITTNDHLCPPLTGATPVSGVGSQWEAQPNGVKPASTAEAPEAPGCGPTCGAGQVGRLHC